MKRILTLSILFGISMTLGMYFRAGMVSASAQARTIITNQEVPASTHEEVQDCTGTTVNFTGTLHIVTEITIAPSGRRHLTLHENFQNVTATNTVTGAEYHAGDAGTLTISLERPFPFEFTSTESTVMTAPGPNNNLLVKAVVHHTINADGTTTSVVERFIIECR